jgi:hypothetical protein
MTDALALWVLKGERHRSRRLRRLGLVKDQQEFAELIKKEVAARRMKPDDATLLIIEL